MADLAAARQAVAPLLGESRLDRELIGALWAIMHAGWAWALAPGGMLERNHLMTAADRQRLADYLETFGIDTLLAFDGIEADGGA